MASITTIQPTDFLTYSRTTLNQNFTNVNNDLSALFTAVSAISSIGATNTTNAISALSAQTTTNTNNIIALSAGGGNPYINNVQVTNYGLYAGKPNDLISIHAASVTLSTSNPLYNGNILFNSNNGYIQHYTGGPGTQLIDDCGQSIFGGNWLEFYRTNTLSGYSILNGTAYTVSDRPIWPLSNGTTEGLLLYGSNLNSSIFIGSYPNYSPSTASIYLPSVNNSNNNWAVEITGPGGVNTQQLNVGFKPLYGNIGTSSISSNNLTIIPQGDGNTMQISAYNVLSTLATSYLIGTSNTFENGNIALSSNNGYIQHYGSSTQLIDDCGQSIYGGNWLEFCRYNTLSGYNILNGTAYIISDRPQWPIANNSNEGLLVYGTTNNSSIFIGSYANYSPYTPSIYIPSVNSASAVNARVEINGWNGLYTHKIRVGDHALYNNSQTLPTSANNLDIFSHSTSTMIVSAFNDLNITANTIEVSGVSALNFVNGLLIGPYAPAHSYGAPGDVAGTVAFDTNYIYYCTTNYVNTSTNIWKRVQLSATTW